MELKQRVKWIMAGYYDAIERIPYKRAPDHPEEVLQLCQEQAPLEVGLYWEGWNAGVNDVARQMIAGRL